MVGQVKNHNNRKQGWQGDKAYFMTLDDADLQE